MTADIQPDLFVFRFRPDLITVESHQRANEVAVQFEVLSSLSEKRRV